MCKLIVFVMFGVCWPWSIINALYIALYELWYSIKQHGLCPGEIAPAMEAGFALGSGWPSVSFTWCFIGGARKTYRCGVLFNKKQNHGLLWYPKHLCIWSLVVMRSGGVMGTFANFVFYTQVMAAALVCSNYLWPCLSGSLGHRT